ncbi:MAG: FAD-dependent oxidoreductase, partial [Marinicella sp.]
MNPKNMKNENPDKVIIVGGGIIGVASAHYLNALGLDVTIIDQGQIGGGSSFGNCGYICPSHMLPLAEPGMVMTGIKSLLSPKAAFKIKPQLRMALYRWLYRFARRCNHQQMLAGGHQLKAILNDSRQEFETLLT